MVFSSLYFLFLYLPIVLFLYYITPLKWRNLLLLLVNLVFYAWGEPVYILIMFLSIGIDYTHGMLVEKYKRRGNDRGARWAVASSVIFNLALLFFFKYWDFVAGSLQAIGFSFMPKLGLSLPIGISFYTFQTMSYTIDVYRDDAKVQRSLVNFGTFVTLFPQLIAGPIIKYKDLGDQIDHRTHSPEQFASGVQIFIVGLGKKVLLLDADPQANATSGLGFDINAEGIYECITGARRASEVILRSEDVKRLWLLPSSINLVAADTELPKMEQGHHVVKRILAEVRDDYDYVLVDCSPSLGYTTVNVLTAADSVLIPVQCEYLALEGLSKLLNTIKIVKSGLNPALEIEGFVLTMYMRNRLNNQVATEVREHFGPLTFDTIIQRNIRLGEAPSHGKPVMLYDAAASGSVNYLNLAKELLKRNRKNGN